MNLIMYVNMIQKATNKFLVIVIDSFIVVQLFLEKY